MTMNIDDLDFTKSEGATVAKESGSGGGFQREIEFLRLDGSPSAIAQGTNRALVRLVTEHERKEWMGGNSPWTLPWITVKQHYAATKERPAYAREGQKWPSKLYCVCRKDKIFSARYKGDCYVCTSGAKASDRSWALAVEREQITEGGRIVGTRDKVREVLDFDADGKAIVESEADGKKIYKKKTVPAWVVLNFGWKNFFNGLNGQAQYYQSVLGRDFLIQRTGVDNNDTQYTFIPMDPITISGEWATQLGVPDGTPYDLGVTVAEVDGRKISLSELLYPDMPDLRRIVAERTTDDYYGRWFVPGWVPEGEAAGAAAPPASGSSQAYNPPGTAAAPATPAAPAQQAPAGPDSSALANLRNRINGQG